MKTNLNLIIIIFLAMHSKLNAQLNLPLKFKEDVIKWSELSWMEEQGKNDQFILMSSPPIITDDTLYLFMNYYQKEVENGKNYGYCGYTIKKINKVSGEKYWETKRKYKEYGNRKMLSQPRIKNGTIEVALYDEALASGYGTDWYECYPVYIVMDRLTGSITDSSYVDKTDEVLPRLRSFGDLYFTGSTRPTIYMSDNGYLHLRQGFGEILSSKIEISGDLIRVDSFKFPNFKYNPWVIKFEKVANDSLWLIMLTRAQKWTDIEVLFSKYDKDMNLDTTYNLSKYIPKPYTSAGISRSDNGYFTVATGYIDFDAKTDKRSEYMFDSNGNFLDSISYTLRPGIDDIGQYGWLWTLFDRANNRLLMTKSRQIKRSESTYFEIYTNDGDKLKTIKRIEVEGIRDHFRIDHATMLDNGDILMYIHQFTDPSGFGDRWYSWVLLDGAKMNIISSTKEEITTRKRLIIFPNPATDYITLSGLTFTSKISIYAADGRQIGSPVIHDDQIDVSQLTAGLYFLRVTDGANVSNYKFMKQ